MCRTEIHPEVWILEPVKLALAKENAKRSSMQVFRLDAFLLGSDLLSNKQEEQLPLPWELIDKVRTRRPIVLTVANSVTIGKVADAVSAVGASPIMSKEPAEAPAMVKIANAITINLGTITSGQLRQIHAVLRCNDTLPTVLDPVAVGSIKYRLKIAQELLAAYHFTVIRGNAGEIAALAGADWQAYGIDAGTGSHDLVAIAQSCAAKYHCIVVLSGATDVVTDGRQTVLNPLSTDWFTVNVGSGDMLSSVIAAYLGLNCDCFKACAVATKAFSIAGAAAAQQKPGLGAWQAAFFDQLSQLSTAFIQKRI